MCLALTFLNPKLKTIKRGYDMTKKTIIWLEDNPKSIENDIAEIKEKFKDNLDIQIWDGNYKESRGNECLEDFDRRVTENKDNIVAFILDVRITVIDLTKLGLSDDIQTQKGFTTGLQIAKYYLGNQDDYSPLQNVFKETPVMFFSVAGGLKNEEFIKNNPNKYSVIEKTTGAKFEELKKWLRRF